MSHEQDGRTPEMRDDMNCQTPKAMGEAPAYQNPHPDSAQPGYHAMPQDRYMGGPDHAPVQNQGNNVPPNSAQSGYHAMPQDRCMGGAGYPPVQNGSQMPNGPYQGQPYHAMPQDRYMDRAGYPPVQNGGQMPNGSYQGQPYQGQPYQGQPQAPAWPYPPQNQGNNVPYQNHYYDPYSVPPGYPPRMPENNQPTNAGLASFLNFRDERFLKGALVGAAVTFLLTNDSVQKNAIQSIVKVWDLFQGGFEEVKERFRDAEAEIKTKPE